MRTICWLFVWSLRCAIARSFSISVFSFYKTALLLLSSFCDTVQQVSSLLKKETQLNTPPLAPYNSYSTVSTAAVLLCTISVCQQVLQNVQMGVEGRKLLPVWYFFFLLNIAYCTGLICLFLLQTNTNSLHSV